MKESRFFFTSEPNTDTKQRAKHQTVVYTQRHTENRPAVRFHVTLYIRTAQGSDKEFPRQEKTKERRSFVLVSA